MENKNSENPGLCACGRGFLTREISVSKRTKDQCRECYAEEKVVKFEMELKKKQETLARREESRKKLETLLKPGQVFNKVIYSASYLDLSWEVLKEVAKMAIVDEKNISPPKLHGMALYNDNKAKMAEFLSINPGMKLKYGLSNMYLSHQWKDIEREARIILVPGKPRKGQLSGSRNA